jgi:uncharacterized protein YvpB
MLLLKNTLYEIVSKLSVTINNSAFANVAQNFHSDLAEICGIGISQLKMILVEQVVLTLLIREISDAFWRRR